MAYKVPVYDEQQVAPQALPGVQVGLQLQPDDIDGGIGKDVVQAVGTAAPAIAREQKLAERRANVTASQKAEAEFQAALNQQLDGDSEAGIQGILQSQGDAAYQQSDGYRKRWEEHRQELLRDLPNDEARRMFDLRSQKMLGAGAVSVERHLGQQTIVVRDATMKANESSGLKAIIARPFSDEVYFEQLARITSGLHEQAKAQGFGPEHAITQAAVRDWEGQAAEVRIRQLIASPVPGAHEKAQALFTLAQTQGVLGKDSADLEARLAQNSFDVAGSATAASWVRGATNGAGRPNTDAVLKQLSDFNADPKGDPRLKKAVQENVEHQLRLATARWAAKEDDVFNRAYTKVVAAGMDLNAAKDEKGYLLSPSVNGGKAWQAIADKVEAERREKEGAPPTPEQQRAFTDFLFDISDPAKKGDYGPGGKLGTAAAFNEKWAKPLAARDMRAAEQHVAALRASFAKPDETLPPDVNQQLYGVARAALGAAKKTDPKNWPEDKRNAYYQAYHDLLGKQAAAKLKGETLKPEDVQKSFEYWFTPGRVEGSGIFFDDTATRAEATTKPDYQGKTYVPDLESSPALKKRKEEIVKELEAADIMPDPGAVNWMYQRSMGQDPPRPKDLRVGIKKHRAADASNGALRVGSITP